MTFFKASSLVTIATFAMAALAPSSVAATADIVQVNDMEPSIRGLRGASLDDNMSGLEVHRDLAGNFKFSYTAQLQGTIVVPQVTNTKVTDISSGCGGSNQKCSCTVEFYDPMAKLVKVKMYGEGTDGTATGLDFKCKFDTHWYEGDAKTCTTTLHINIPYVGSNSFSFSSSCVGGNSYSAGGGHDLSGSDVLVQV